MADIQEAITIGELSRQLKKFEERLFGNGQPGVISKMDERLDDAESKWDRVAGGGAVIAILLSLIEAWHILHK